MTFRNPFKKPTPENPNEEKDWKKPEHIPGETLEISINPHDGGSGMGNVYLVAENGEKKLVVTCLENNTETQIQNPGEITEGDILRIARFGIVRIDSVKETE